MSTQAESPELTFDGSGNEFLSLEEKIYRTIELLKNARAARATAEREAEQVLEQLELREAELQAAKTELIAMKKEREEVRSRVEKMLSQMDAIITEEQS